MSGHGSARAQSRGSVGGPSTRRVSRSLGSSIAAAAATAVALVGAVVLATSALVGSLISVNPLGASPGVPIQISGTGFDPTASKNHVTFTPLGGGTQLTVPASAIATVDATRGIRRVNVAVPAGLPAGKAALSVTNTTTGEISEGQTLDALYLTLPEVASAVPGTTGVKVVMTGSAGTVFTTPSTTRVAFGAGIIVRSVVVESAQRLTAVIDVSPAATLGPRSAAVRPPNQYLLAADAFTVGSPPANQPPTASANGPYSGTVGEAVTFTSKGSSDPDADALTFAWTFGDGGTSGEANPTHTYQSAGSFSVSLTVSDGKGGTHTASTTAQIEPPAAQVTGIDAEPALVRFSALEATRALTVIASKSDGTAVDVTAAAAGTTYSSSNAFVAAVSADGLVTARGNGDVTITARNGPFSDTVAVAVEVGVTLTSLALIPETATLRLGGATQPLVLKGTFSDGSVRDLTSAAGTTYQSSVENVATVGADGVVTAVADGETAIVASHADMTAGANILVSIPGGRGFIRGAAFDDSRGLPLAGATATLIADGGGALEPPVTTTTDGTGRYVLQGRAGDGTIVVQKDGFTAVHRSVIIPSTGAVRVFDARLTPVDGRPNPLQSAFGGQARDAAGATTLLVPPGALAADVDLRLTPLSAQGLAGLLPPGWSPVAAMEVRPVEITLAQPATLSLPNVGGAPASSAVTMAVYDRTAQQWTVTPGGQVSADGRTINLAISGGGQFVALLPDTPPHAPPTAVDGARLAGSSLVALPVDLSADGVVVPRAAAPGDNARAVGRVGIGGTQSLPSGTSVQVHVSETFELLDASTVAPLPFTQDILVHARPRPPTGGSLGASFPITPSRTYTIQELMRGVVTLEVAAPSAEAGGSVAGSQGAVVTSEHGDTLTIPAGALGTETLVDLRRQAAPVLTGIPTTFTTVAAFEVDIIGVSLTLPGRLSTAVPAGVTAADQILLVESFIDAFGVRRLRVAGIGRIEGDRLVSDHLPGSLAFSGVTGAGAYFFLKSPEPLGFVTGIVTGADSSTPAPLALVTSSTAAFVDVTGATGRYIVAARAAADGIVSARHLLSSDAATGIAHPAARDAIVVLPLTLAVAPPSVVAVSPTAGATNVPLDTSITIDFSEPMDPSSVSESSVALQTSGAPVGVSRTLSQDRRRLTVRPESPLLGKTTYTLSLTSTLKDLSGAPLVSFTPLTFTTLDPAKPPQPPPGQIVAELPDQDALVLITGSPGSAEAGTPVTATNPRTQETFTVLAATDGSFRLRIGAVIGDEIVLTFRDSSSRETTIAVTQFVAADGSTSIGASGGTFQDAVGRVGTILPRALTAPGVFKFDEVTPQPSVALSGSFSYVDRFGLRADGAGFNRLASLTLIESQGRFIPVSTLGAPFEARGELTVPGEFLLNSALRFTATAQDTTGVRRSVTASTVVVAANADVTSTESAAAFEFPSLFLTTSREALQNQIVAAHAVAPGARVDLRIPAPLDAGEIFLLTRAVEVAGEPKLAVVDLLTLATSDAGPVLQTSGRALPGMTTAGQHAVVRSTEPLVLISGELVGAAGVVAVEELPFVFETGGPNGRFAVPVRANQPFTLRFFNADGSVRGTSSGQAPATGALEVGDPLGLSTGQLTLSSEPSPNSIVDIDQPIVLRFSEPVDLRTLAAGVVVTDSAGARVFGQFDSGNGGVTVQFRPARRWRYATTYRFGVATSVLAQSGAKLAQPFNGGFTTFAPSVLSTAAIGTGQAAAVSGSLAILGTDTGVHVLDVSSPVAPQLRATLSFPGGARGVALLTTSTLIDRNGQSLSGTFAVIASGDAATGGRLQIFNVTAPDSPVLVGSAQLTAQPGQNPPPGVPAAVGTPRQVVLTHDHRALVAVEGVGVVSVVLGQMIPVDPSAPGIALGPRYPVDALESITGVALLDDRVVAVGAAGVTVLDATTLLRRGGLSTGASLRSVDAMSSFAMDINGDRIVADTELFDLAVATGGDDQTIQYVRVPRVGDPTLLSVIRHSADTASVRLSRDERLAYVATGAGGLAFVDLDGPGSVQPIDLDRNGTDDRILMSLGLSGVANGFGLEPAGFAVVANGPGGLSTVQLVPSRATFTAIQRDPVRIMTGDEQPVAAPHVIFASDDALLVTVRAIASPGDNLVLTIQETPDDGGLPVLRFADGGTAAALSAGTNTLTIELDAQTIHRRSRARLRVQTSSGQMLTELDLSVAGHDSGGAAVGALRIAPDAATLPAELETLQLGVVGFLENGVVLNLTSAESGTTFSSEIVDVASVGPDGLVTAVAGGDTRVMAANAGGLAFTSLTIQRPVRLVTLAPTADRITLRRAGESRDAGFVGRFSDRTLQQAADISGTTFRSADPAIATVDAAGRITAVASGDVSIIAENGALSAQVLVTNDFRTPASVASIELQPIPSPFSADGDQVVATAIVSGSGSLDGLEISFAANGALTSAAVATSDLAGAAFVAFGPLTTAGTLALTASVVDPATGQTRSDSQTIDITPRTGDNEPNDDPASAPLLDDGRTTTGSITATTDTRDVYRLSTSSDGTVEITLDIGDLAAQGSVALIVRGANGEELARFTVSAGRTIRTITLPAGAASISVEALSGSATYSLSFTFQQVQPSITSVSPLGGPVGTTVTITGTGFSTASEAVLVLFNGVAGKLLTVTPTVITVQVPAYAANGLIEVISGGKAVVGPLFSTGLAAEPPDFFIQPQLAFVRRTPDGIPLVVNRLLVSFDPTLGRPGVDAILQQVGGTVVGFDGADNSFVVEFPNNTSLDFLYQRLRALEANPAVALVTVDSLLEPDSSRRIDMSDISVAFAAAHQQIRLFDAIRAVRRSRFETDALASVRVAVLDDGIRSVPDLAGVTVDEGPAGGSGEHGTPVAGVIGMRNNKEHYSGALNSVKFDGEPPFRVHVFTVWLESSNYLYKSSVRAAFKRINRRNRDGDNLNDFDVVNLSFGGFKVGANVEKERRWWKARLKPLEARTLVVASAGNDGFHTFFPGRFGHFPSAMAFAAPPGGQPLKNVLSVGASATELSNRGPADERSTFAGAHTGVFACRGGTTVETNRAESNCSPGMSIAAPGNEVPSVRATGALTFFDGTSAAAPLVASIAAMVQSIRPDIFIRLSPEDLAKILLASADEISEIWTAVDEGQTLRLNAMSAVRATLPAPPPPNVYVADTDANVVIALSADPITGVVGQTAKRIPLAVSRPDFEFTGSRPTTLAVSPTGDRLYVAAENEFGNFGVAIINTDRLETVHFIALHQVGCGTPGQTAMVMETLRPGMAFSKDGRLLYVTNGTRLVVINTDTEEQVHRVKQLPAPYLTSTNTTPDIACRLEDIRDLATDGTLGLKGTALAALELSPDGRILYVAMQAGRGNDSQPGAILPIDVNVYDDGGPRVGLQPDLSKFLKPAFEAANVKSFQMPPDPPDVVVELAKAIKGDEPSDLAVSPDGRFVYLLNGGVQAYSGAIPDDENLKVAILGALGGVVIGTTIAAAGGNLISTAIGSAVGGAIVNGALVHDILPEMIRFSREVGVIVTAPGITAAFDTKANPPGEVPWFFTGNTAFGWVVGTDRDGFNANQRSFDQIFSSRPFGIGMKPDGSRAVVSFFQTGNFGVLDESAQSFFKNINPAFSQAPSGVYQGLAAVTPAIRFDRFLWPENPDDERLLYPTAVEYAQNGRFAVGIHTGASGAGAVSVLDDELINRDLVGHVGTTAPGFPRSYFAQVPLCDTVDPATFRCTAEVGTRLFDYNAGGGATTFKRPRGLAIDPFLVVEAPRFGDFLRLGQSVHVRWRTVAGSEVTRLEFLVEDLGPSNAPTVPSQVGPAVPVDIDPNTLESVSQSVSVGVIPLFNNDPAKPNDGNRYRITVRAFAGSQRLSETSVVVMYVD